MSVLHIAWWLLIAHVVCDYPLQGDFLARGKNHRNPIPGVPWWQCLLAHSLIQGGGVALATGIPLLGAVEVLFHAMIDFGKCDCRYGFNGDQVMHFACKGAWLLVVWGWLK